MAQSSGAIIFNTGWHVLYVKSRYEKKVYKFLKEESLEPFLPLVKTNTTME